MQKRCFRNLPTCNCSSFITDGSVSGGGRKGQEGVTPVVGVRRGGASSAHLLRGDPKLAAARSAAPPARWWSEALGSPVGTAPVSLFTWVFNGQFAHVSYGPPSAPLLTVLGAQMASAGAHIIASAGAQRASGGAQIVTYERVTWQTETHRPTTQQPRTERLSFRSC